MRKEDTAFFRRHREAVLLSGIEKVIERVVLGKWSARILTIVMSFLILHIFAKFVFALYLLRHRFFSYDFLLSNEYGSGFFFFSSELYLVLSAGLIFGWAILRKLPEDNFLNRDKTAQEAVCVLRWISGIFALIVLLLSFILMYSKWGTVGFEAYAATLLSYTGFLCAIAFYIRTVLFENGLRRIMKAGGAWLVMFLGAIIQHQFSGSLVSLGLNMFGAGGMLPIVYRTLQSEKVNEGFLVLQSPNYLYVRRDEADGAPVVTIPVSTISEWSRREISKATKK
jgi:hypothetical protein